MVLESDLYVDRKRLKRHLTLWRLAAVATGLAVLLVLIGRSDSLSLKQDHVARLEVTGLIVEDRERDEALEALIEDSSTKALVVAIDSPGGTMVGGESLYLILRRVAEKKPVVAVMGSMATSAAYMTALGCERVFARSGSLTGSIGVLMAETDITGLLDKIGVKPEIIKSAPLKAQPNPLEPFTPEAREAMREVIMDSFDQFLAMVTERREMTREQALVLADGRVYTGRQALANGLVDAIGGEREARQWLAEAHAIAESVPTTNLVIEREEETWRRLLDGLAGNALFSKPFSLDGIISVWHPAGL